MSKRVVIGTRRSLLARAQTAWVADRIGDLHPGVEVVLEPITTRGDRKPDTPLPAIGGKGLFTAELEEALLEGRIDLAVHSAKDLPTEMPDGLHLAAVPPRADPRDALIARRGKTLDDLPENATIGTSSTRRCAQLRLLRKDFRFATLRGNVDTRINKVRRGDCDATLLAMAGLARAGLAHEAAGILDLDVMIPAPGQGTLALQSRTDDGRTNELLRKLDDPDSAAALSCERAVLASLQGGCQAPIGVLVRRDGSQWQCHAIVASPQGTAAARAAVTGLLDTLAQRVVAALTQQGAADIIAACRQQEETE